MKDLIKKFNMGELKLVSTQWMKMAKKLIKGSAGA
jgi:hypothetical protein